MTFSWPNRAGSSVALLLLLAPLPAQEPQRPVPTFRIGADLVVVDVSVIDKLGKPVQHLTQQDFSLQEDGRPQEIQLFAVEDILTEETRAAADLQVQRLAPADVPGAPAAPNDAPVDVRNKRWMILFFDLTSLPAADLMRAHRSSVDFLERSMTAADLISVVTFDNDLRVSQDFTQDRAAIRKALDRLVAEPESGLVAGEEAEPVSEEETTEEFLADETEFNIFNSDRKLAAIETIAQWLTPYPERKALIHYSGGISRTGTENQAQLRATIAAAGKANLSIYPVDARGLVAMPSGGDAARASRGGRSQFDGSAVGRQFSNLSGSQDTLWALAEDTGGSAFFDSNDLSPVFKQVRDDISHYYILGYYSTNTKADGKYRQIRVTVRVPDVKVKHRKGYYASKSFQQLTKGERNRHLEEAAALDALSSEFPLALSSGHFRTGDDVYYVPVSLRFPSLNIPFLQKKGRHRTEFDFVGQVRGDKERLVTFVKDTVRLDLDDPTFRDLEHKSIQYDTGFYLRPGDYSMKFLVRENQSGKLGVFEEALRVPEAENTGLGLSSVMLGSQLQDLEGSAAGVRVVVDDELRQFFRRRGAAQNPLVFEGRKLVPSVTRVFRPGDPLYIVFEVYGAQVDPAAKSPDVVVALTFWRGTQKVSETPVYQVTQFDDEARRVIGCRYQASLAGFAPGRYTLQVGVIDQVAGSHTQARVPIAVQ